MSKQCNILLVANWESDVGYAWWLMENFWNAIAEHFKQHSMKCHLIYPHVTRLPQSIEQSGIVVHECDFSDRSISGMRKLYRIIHTNDIRCAYLTDQPAYSAYYLLLRFWGIHKIAMHDHTPGERRIPNAWKRFLKSAIQRIPLYTVDKLISVTNYVHQRHLEVNCAPEYKCATAENGIAPIDIHPEHANYVREKLGIPEDRTVIVTTGRASRYKRIDFIIECAHELINNRQLHNLHFLFCGDGPDIVEFKSLVKKHGLIHHFTFAGKRNDVRLILPSCDIGLHASTGEVGYSLSILEYMSAGLVTVIPDNPSVSLATSHMEDGIIYGAGNIRSAADAVETAINHPKAVSIRRNAIEKVKNRYTLTRTNAQLVNILASMFTNHKQER